MATGTQYSAWSAYKLPSGASNKRRVRTYYTWTTSETATTFSIAIKAYAQMQGGSATMGGNTVTVSATGQSSVSNTFKFVYDETTLHNPVNKTYTWKKTATAQTVTVKSTYKVASGNLFAGTYVASGTFTIPALAPVTISFDANNGSGTVPTAISTYIGVANTIPSNSLTRTGYTFNGWNTASDGSGMAYATGSKITSSGNVTLYAQWKTTYVKPEIQNLLAFRVADKSGEATPTVTSTGTTGFCRFELVGGAEYTFTSASVQFGTGTANSMTQSGTTVYGYSDVGAVAETSAYTVNVTVVVTGTDGILRTYTDSTYMSKAVPVFDATPNSFALGGTARDVTGDEKVFDCYMDAYFSSDVTVGGHDSPIGTRLTTSKSNIRVAAGVDNPHYGAALTLGKGTWIAMGRWSFNTRASGTTSSNRQASIVVNGTIWMSQRTNTYGGNFGTVQCVAMLNLTEESNTVVCAGSCSQATSGTNYDNSILDVVRIA